jgi:hypothetical protein
MVFRLKYKSKLIKRRSRVITYRGSAAKYTQRRRIKFRHKEDDSLCVRAGFIFCRYESMVIIEVFAIRQDEDAADAGRRRRNSIKIQILICVECRILFML